MFCLVSEDSPGLRRRGVMSPQGIVRVGWIETDNLWFTIAAWVESLRF
jgi:hypothetical protein